MDGRVKRGPSRTWWLRGDRHGLGGLGFLGSRTWWLRVLGVGRCHELGGLGFWGLGDSGLGVGVSGRTRTGENLKSKLKSSQHAGADAVSDVTADAGPLTAQHTQMQGMGDTGGGREEGGEGGFVEAASPARGFAPPGGVKAVTVSTLPRPLAEGGSPSGDDVVCAAAVAPGKGEGAAPSPRPIAEDTGTQSTQSRAATREERGAGRLRQGARQPARKGFLASLIFAGELD
jgi:hypothetical protein